MRILLQLFFLCRDCQKNNLPFIIIAVISKELRRVPDPVQGQNPGLSLAPFVVRRAFPCSVRRQDGKMGLEHFLPAALSRSAGKRLGHVINDI
jgi:hypothetical protein